MQSIDLLYEYLEESELGDFYSGFKKEGFTLESISKSTLQEIASKVGINNKNDKRKLFEFMQIVKDTVQDLTPTIKDDHKPCEDEEIFKKYEPIDLKFDTEDKENKKLDESFNFDLNDTITLEPLSKSFMELEKVTQQIDPFQKEVLSPKTPTKEPQKRKKLKSSSICVTVR